MPPSSISTWHELAEVSSSWIPHCIQLEMFYNGLNAQTRLVVDASANGALLSKSYNEAYEIIERIANNNYQWSTSQATLGRRVVGVHEVDSLTSLSAQPPSQFDVVSCVYCGDDHSFENCPSNSESIYYIGNQHQNKSRQGPQPNFYNPSWLNHLNFS
ncbi:Retrotransposon gag protein [Gossypium australe]|uniref:Retrotransposon gag protein n=1 Tax=Gossypium australe TaxID=47621 RepID=A0A5B6X0P0_9ROSI|nr:Retrotransposon gag protein [Gossypium australe]